MQYKMSRILKLNRFLKDYFLGTEIRDFCRYEREIYPIFCDELVAERRLKESKHTEITFGPIGKNVASLTDLGLIVLAALTKEPLFASFIVPIEGVRFLSYKLGNRYIRENLEMTRGIQNSYLKENEQPQRTGRNYKDRTIVAQEEESQGWDDTDGYDGWSNPKNNWGLG